MDEPSNNIPFFHDLAMNGEDMVEIKGTTIQSRLEYIRETLGKECETEALNSLKKKYGETAAGIILPMSWYPLSMDDAICLFIKSRSGLPGEKSFQELGRHSAAAHLKFFKVALGSAKTPGEVIAKMPILNRSYVRNYGEMTLADSGPNHAELMIAGHPETFRSVCSSTVAYIAEMCSLVVGVSVRGSEPACLCHRHDHCSYRFEW
jgi:hypothetical protein